jgi:UDPglucose--hexose-1-phosphate uridylyltransferase
MPELRCDPVSGRWVIIAAERGDRPDEFVRDRPSVVREDVCPFCPTHEACTPPEVLAYRPAGGAPDSPGWDVRVVPNKFPALRRSDAGDAVLSGDGLFTCMDGVGVHEVLIESPAHGQTLGAMPSADIERALSAFAARIRTFREDHRLRYFVLFKNQGPTAGATFEHTHSQIMALPVVPNGVREELDGAARYFDSRGRCVFCDLVRDEVAAGTRVVYVDAGVVVLAPYASRVPFELWVVPRAHGATFEDATPEGRAALARGLRVALSRLARVLDAPDYNYIIHTAPVGDDSRASYHWHAEILPKLSRMGGLEWGTGCHINTTAPEAAAAALRATAGLD